MTEELKIEVGKSYRTRGGEKFTCKLVDFEAKYPVFGLYSDSTWGSYRSDGRHLFAKQHHRDLIEEWVDEPKEPECIDVSEMWVVVNEDCDGKIGIDGTYYKNKEDCLTYKNTIAILTSYEWERRKSGAVPLVRGEGLEYKINPQ